MKSLTFQEDGDAGKGQKDAMPVDGKVDRRLLRTEPVAIVVRAPRGEAEVLEEEDAEENDEAFAQEQGLEAKFKSAGFRVPFVFGWC